MPFGKGSKGAGVKQLQQKLDAMIREANREAQQDGGPSTGLIGVIADGSFGQNTAVALAVYQRHHGLSPSGYADAATLRELGLDENLSAEGAASSSTEDEEE